MAGEVYQTEGIILGHYNYGEDDKIISSITDKCGYIYAKSVGTRKITSKLRSNLADYNHVNLDLVMGRVGWKIIGASQISGLRGEENETGVRVFSRIAKLIGKIAGEEDNQPLFLEVKKLFDDIKSNKKIDKYSELLTVIRILYHLGYWDDKKIPQGEIKEKYKKLLEEVNLAIDGAIA